MRVLITGGAGFIGSHLAEYFQGKSCPEGMLPYRERYIFTRTKDIVIDPEEDAAYVLPDTELEYFPEEDFRLERFGFYFTAVPKKG